MQDSESRLAALYRRFDNIDAVLSAHDHASYSMTAGGRMLLERTSALLLQARDALDFRWNRLEPLPESIREVLRRKTCGDFASVLLELADALLPALDGAMSQGVPIELEAVLTRIARHASGDPDTEIVLYASELLNYSIEAHSDPNVTLPRLLAPGMATSPAADILFLRVPRIERDSAILHAVIAGHEIGHLRDWTHRLSALKAPIPALPHWLDTNNEVLPEQAQAVERYIQVATSWASELVADLLGAFTMGPASLASFSELVGTLGNWTHDSPSHPGSDRRAAILVDLFTRDGFGAASPFVRRLLAHFSDETQGAMTRSVAIQDSPYPESDQAAWDLITQRLPDFETRCRKIIDASERFEIASWPAAERCAAELASGRPCGEAFDSTSTLAPTDDNVIFNAALVARTDHLDALGKRLALDASQPADASQIAAILDQLVLKSFEVAEHRRQEPWT